MFYKTEPKSSILYYRQQRRTTQCAETLFESERVLSSFLPCDRSLWRCVIRRGVLQARAFSESRVNKIITLESSGYYMYRQRSRYVPPAVTICTASGHCMYRQWSLYVPHGGHFMYRTVVTVCTAQWSLYVPPAVTVCTAQWSLYVPHSGHYVYRTVVTICATSLTFSNSTFCPHSVFMCFVWI